MSGESCPIGFSGFWLALGGLTLLAACPPSAGPLEVTLVRPGRADVVARSGDDVVVAHSNSPSSLRLILRSRAARAVALLDCSSDSPTETVAVTPYVDFEIGDVVCMAGQALTVLDETKKQEVKFSFIAEDAGGSVDKIDSGVQDAGSPTQLCRLERLSAPANDLVGAPGAALGPFDALAIAVETLDERPCEIEARILPPSTKASIRPLGRAFRSGQLFQFTAGPAESDVDMTFELEAKSLSVVRSAVRFRTFTRCPSNRVDAGCLPFDSDNVVGVDSRAFRLLASPSTRVPLVSNEFAPFLNPDQSPKAVDLAVDSTGRVWVATRDSICEASTQNGVVRNCVALAVGDEIRGLGDHPLGNELLSVAAGSRVFSVDLATFTALTPLWTNPSNAPVEDCAASEGSLVCVSASIVGSSLFALNPDGGSALERTIPLSAVTGLAVGTSGASLVAVSQNGFVSEIFPDGGSSDRFVGAGMLGLASRRR
jgi:hypothetical protein